MEQETGFNCTNMWQVYVLYNNKIPGYVGCSFNLEQRVKKHKKDKIFNSCASQYDLDCLLYVISPK